MHDHKPRPPTHAAIGDEFIHRQSGTAFRLTPDGWRPMLRTTEYPRRNNTIAIALASPTALSDLVCEFLTRYRLARTRSPGTWDDRPWAAPYALSLARIADTGTVASVIAATKAATDAFHTAVEAASATDGFDWSSHADACAWRCAVFELRWRYALHYPLPLAELIETAADDIHGGCALSFDGDCFEPPEWSAYITGWPFITYGGGGDNPEDAVRRAMWQKYHAREQHRAERETPEWKAQQEAKLADLRAALSADAQAGQHDDTPTEQTQEPA